MPIMVLTNRMPMQVIVGARHIMCYAKVTSKLESVI